MALETIEAKYQVKDEDGNLVKDEETGKVLMDGCAVQYDFGDVLDDAVGKCGAETVFSNYRANARVTLQGIVRAKHRAGMAVEQIQEIVNSWKPGVVVEKTPVDIESAAVAAFKTWAPEKQKAYLEKLGVPAEAAAALGL